MGARADDAATRSERARMIGLFRYQLIRRPLIPGCRPAPGAGWSARSPRPSTSTRPGGGCGSPATPWTGGSGRGGAAGSTPWCPALRQSTPRLPAEVIKIAVALKRENPQRTAAQVRRILAIRVYSVSEDKGITLRQAAMVAAIREVAAALEARGIYP